MDIFGEKKYEELDWLTKACEPVTWSLLDLLEVLPNEVRIPDYVVIEAAKTQRLSFRDMMDKYVQPTKKLGRQLSYKEQTVVNACYELQVSDQDFIVNLIDNTIQGEVKIVKVKEGLTEQELNKELQETTLQYRISISDNTAAAERAREILDLMGTAISLKSKSARSSRSLESALYSSFSDVMKNGRWNIKSIDLAERAGKWITSYVDDGNPAAMRNFCLLKAATHRGLPIYSIDEEVV